MFKNGNRSGEQGLLEKWKFPHSKFKILKMVKDMEREDMMKNGQRGYGEN